MVPSHGNGCANRDNNFFSLKHSYTFTYYSEFNIHIKCDFKNLYIKILRNAQLLFRNKNIADDMTNFK